MRRIAIALMGTMSGLVLLFSYHTSLGGNGDAGGGGMALTGTGDTGTATQNDQQLTGQNQTAAQDDQDGQEGQDGQTASPTPTPSKAAGTSGTFTGAVAQTRWGPVQVQIVVKNKKITKVNVLQRPTGHQRSDQINAYALPKLNAETVQANSAGIDSVGGATVTSQGYISSLQSALDKAHL